MYVYENFNYFASLSVPLYLCKSVLLIIGAIYILYISKVLEGIDP